MKTCPFCGLRLEAVANFRAHGNSGYAHALNGCILAGQFMGKERMVLWNTREAVGQLAYEVVDNGPRFNDDGRGIPCDSEFVNKCMDYYQNSSLQDQKLGI